MANPGRGDTDAQEVRLKNEVPTKKACFISTFTISYFSTKNVLSDAQGLYKVFSRRHQVGDAMAGCRFATNAGASCTRSMIDPRIKSVSPSRRDVFCDTVCFTPRATHALSLPSLLPLPPRVSPPDCHVRWAGELLTLLPDRALWWPAGESLFIADLHLGKAATYRALGQPVPGGTTQENLARLDALIARHRPQRIVFLGDFLHAAQARTPTIFAALATWRARHAAIAMTLVRGNHDSRAGDPPASLQIEVVDEPWLLGPFACCHHPQVHPTHFVLAGHLHPACRVHGPGRDSLRLPCFVSDVQQATEVTRSQPGIAARRE